MHAVGLVARTVRLLDPADKERWTVQIADENGALLLTVMFPVLGLRPAAFGRERAAPHSTPDRHLSQNTPAVLRAYAASLRDRSQPLMLAQVLTRRTEESLSQAGHGRQERPSADRSVSCPPEHKNRHHERNDDE